MRSSIDSIWVDSGFDSNFGVKVSGNIVGETNDLVSSVPGFWDAQPVRKGRMEKAQTSVNNILFKLPPRFFRYTNDSLEIVESGFRIK